MRTSDARLAAVTHPGGPLLIIGGAGTGKTRALADRFMWLTHQGLTPESILFLVHSTRAADELSERLEAGLATPSGELGVTTFREFCAQLLRDEALEAGLDPFAVPVTRADRLAMLLERIDELPLARHDLRGNPSALLGSIVARIDRLKAELVTAADYVAYARGLADSSREAQDGVSAAREQEFAAIYSAHERMLDQAGVLDSGDLVLHAFRLLREQPEVRARLVRRHAHVLVDDLQDTSFAQLLLLRLLAGERGDLTAAGDDDQAIHRFRAAATKNLTDFSSHWPGATVITLEESLRSGARILAAAEAVVRPLGNRLSKDLVPAPEGDPGEVEFWRCASERAQAQAVAADVERLISREDVAPEDVCVLVRSVRGEAQAVSVALEERAVPHAVIGAAAFYQRAEVRDLLAWLRLLTDPADASAAVRALSRPPIELRSVDLARVTQIARRRKLDMVGALGAALESPQVPPEARERITAFLKLHRTAAAALDSSRPDLYVHRLIERLGLRRQLLFAASAEVAERLRNLAKFGELASEYARRSPQATAREFGRSIAAVAEAGLREEEVVAAEAPRGVRVMSMHAAKGLEFQHVYVLGLIASRIPGVRRRALEPIPDALIREALPPDSPDAHAAEMRRLLHVAMTRPRSRLVLAHPELTDRGTAQEPSPFAEEARAAVGGEWQERAEELFGPAETLPSTFRLLRDELLTTVSQVGGRLGELRFDTDLDVSHAMVRYLEVLKLASLMERARAGQPIAETLPEVNRRLLQAVTAEQREIFETSALDDHLLDAERDETLRQRAVTARGEPSLEAFLPRRGEGLLLSASDIQTYLTCPLKYKFARVFRIPSEPTLNQRFGILVHQVLERYHAGSEAGRTLPELLGLLEAGWRRGGFGDSEEERQLRGKATRSLLRYHDRFRSEEREPVWFERSFQFRLGPHLLRGRVDRVDRLPDGGYELIDYKTGRPRTPAQLRDDVQLSLYAVGAREAWQLDAARQAYYYVLDDEKVPVDRGEADRRAIEATVMEVGDGILGQGFEPTPSSATCSQCDFRIACPAAEL